MNALKVLVAAVHHPWNGEAVKILRNTLKCEVDLVDSIAEARSKEARAEYDVVFVDSKLDPENGLALARKIKLSRGHRIVVFYATNKFELNYHPAIPIDRDPWDLAIEVRGNVTMYFSHRMAS